MAAKLNLFTEICSMQNELNIYLNPKWKTANYDFRLAASQELSELIDHLPWKWWKAAKEVDMAQAKLEVVDITHFIIADLLKYFERPELVARMILDTETAYEQAKRDKIVKLVVSDRLATNFDGSVNGRISESKSFDEIIKRTFKLQARLVNCSSIYLPDVLIELWDLYDLELKEIAKIYFSKNTLNMFRYENGYREGTYIKIWPNQNIQQSYSENDTANYIRLDAEDNVVLHSITEYELANWDWTDINTRKELLARLTHRYKQIKVE